MKRLKISQFCRTLLILGLMAGMAAPLQAATGYEVTGVTFSQTVTAQTFVRVTVDLTVSWTAPTETDQILNYFLKFNTSSTPLTGTELDDTAFDFKITSGELFSIIPKDTFNAYDSDTLRYLHIRTQYLDTASENVVYSDDVVSEEIRIDNVAPTGTLTLNPTSGSTKEINVSMSPSEAIKYYWLNDASTIPGVPGTNYSDYPQATVSLSDETSYGDVTISGWFEDFAGNRSTAASASAVYDYTAPVAIQYNASVMNVGGTLGFTVDSSTLYNWTITPSVSGVAEFADDGITLDGHDSVIIEGKAIGTFTVSAVPSLGGAQLTTGTVTVVTGDITIDIPLVAGWNLISIPVQPDDTVTTSVLAGISDKYSVVWGEFDPTTSAWKNFDPNEIFNTLNTMEPNKGYWINVTEACTLTIVAPLATPSVSLKAGWNLIGFVGESDTDIKTVLTAISGKYSVVWGEFDPTTSAWKNFDSNEIFNTLNIMGTGKGYWINVIEDTILTY